LLNVFETAINRNNFVQYYCDSRELSSFVRRLGTFHASGRGQEKSGRSWTTYFGAEGLVELVQLQ